MPCFITLFFSLWLSISSIDGSEKPTTICDHEQFQIGLRHLHHAYSKAHNDHDATEDFQTAAAYLQPLAEKGYSIAQCIYADLLLAESGFTKNATLALHYYMLALADNNLNKDMRHDSEHIVASIYFLENDVMQDADTGLQFLIKSAKGNNQIAMKDLAQIYLKGHGSIQQDLEKAKYWIEKANLAQDDQCSVLLEK